jgi:hypothetical protein
MILEHVEKHSWSNTKTTKHTKKGNTSTTPMSPMMLKNNKLVAMHRRKTKTLSLWHPF